MKSLRTIRNCSFKWKVRCPKAWDELDATSSDSVRHCRECERDVYYCATDVETLDHARLGHCIARAQPDPSELPRIVMGQPGVRPDLTDSQLEAMAWRRREHGIDRVLRGRVDADRTCPACGYPVLSFRKTCYVCGYEIGRTTS